MICDSTSNRRPTLGSILRIEQSTWSCCCFCCCRLLFSSFLVLWCVQLLLLFDGRWNAKSFFDIKEVKKRTSWFRVPFSTPKRKLAETWIRSQIRHFLVWWQTDMRGLTTTGSGISLANNGKQKGRCNYLLQYPTTLQLPYTGRSLYHWKKAVGTQMFITIWMNCLLSEGQMQLPTTISHYFTVTVHG